MRILTAALGILLIVLLVGFLSAYTVDEREYAVVLQFGNPVAERRKPGLYFRVPGIQQVVKLPRQQQFWGGSVEFALPDLPTRDGKKIVVVPWAVWRITDPQTFVQRVGSLERAVYLVSDFVRGATRDALTQHNLVDIVRSTDRELTYRFGEDAAQAMEKLQGLKVERPTVQEPVRVGRQKIVEEIRANLAQQLDEEGGRGFEITNVGIMKVDFVPDVRAAAFRRLTAFMESIAAFYREDGERIKQEILNQTKAEVRRIEGEGKRDAARIRGEAEAEVTRMYASAIRQAGEFYSFLRSLEAYRNSVNDRTRIVVTTGSGFFRILKQFELPEPTEPEAIPPEEVTPERAAAAASAPDRSGND